MRLGYLFAALFCFFSVQAQGADSGDNPIVQKIRYPVALGSLYPEKAKDLKHTVKELLVSADRHFRPDGKIPKALIVPSSSIFLSGRVTAAGYAYLKRVRPFLKRVVILYAPMNKSYFGMVVPEAKFWEMPDRRFEIDTATAERLSQIPGITRDDAPHASEYGAEVQLPFISALFPPEVKILPVLVGDASVLQVSDLIDAVWGGPETVVIVVSQLNDAKTYEDVLERADYVIKRLEKKEYQSLNKRHLTGLLPVKGLLHYASEHDGEVKILARGTSADEFAPSKKVSGYLAAGVYETELSEEERKEKLEKLLQENQEDLLRIAAHSVLSGFKRGRPLYVRESRYADDLSKKGAVFVSLYYNGMLRGSVGSSEPTRSIIRDVSENAYAAAFQDFRFAPLGEDEIKDAEISISLLTPKVPLKFESEEDLLKKMRPHRDGFVLRERENKALFLPSVWDTFSTPKEFLMHLKRKAGLPADYWSSTLKMYRFEVIDINSGDLPDPKSIWEARKR